MEIPQMNYYGLDIDAVYKKFEGDLTFMNTVSVGGVPCMVFKSKNPNKKKGHKKYMLLSVQGKNMFVSGMTPAQMKKYRFSTAIRCLDCDELLISFGRHDYKTCSCPNEAMIDGGDCYIRQGARDLKKIETVQIDLLTRKVL